MYFDRFITTDCVIVYGHRTKDANLLEWRNSRFFICIHLTIPFLSSPLWRHSRSSSPPNFSTVAFPLTQRVLPSVYGPVAFVERLRSVFLSNRIAFEPKHLDWPNRFWWCTRVYGCWVRSVCSRLGRLMMLTFEYLQF